VRFFSTSFSNGIVNWVRQSVPNDGQPVTLE
jgi:hypothetical protein